MVRLTDHVDMTIAADWDVKQQNNISAMHLVLKRRKLPIVSLRARF